jgi:RNA polymerase sigma-70 factor (ECF subfamily)
VATYGGRESCLASAMCGVLKSRAGRGVHAIRELENIDALVRTYRARLLRFLTYASGDADLAESITQDTLLRAYTARETFRGDCSVNTWLTGIAINVLRDHRRTEKFKFWKQVQATAIDAQEMASFLPSEDRTPEAIVLAQERVKHLSRVVETLSFNQRTIFAMRFFEEMDVREISALLNMPLNTVKTHLQRALKVVRNDMGATR